MKGEPWNVMVFRVKSARPRHEVQVFLVHFFSPPSVLIKSEMTRLICDSCLWIKVFLIFFVIENDRRGLRNEETAHSGCHAWNMISVKWPLISLMNMLPWDICLYSWRASNNNIFHSTMFLQLDFFCPLLTISQLKKHPKLQPKHPTGSRLSASTSSSRMMCGFECCSLWFRHD